MSSVNENHTVPSFMQVVIKRGGLLERLAENPAYKRDLVDKLTYSRSTVDRAIRELVDNGLVTSEDGRYRTTASGAVACRAHRRFVDLAEDIDAARDLLAQLPADKSPSPTLLADADITRATEQTRVGLFEPIQSRLREADAITAIVSELADIRHLDIYCQRAAEGVPIDIVFDSELYATLRAQRPRTLRQLGSAESVTAYTAEWSNCGVLLTEQDGSPTVTVLIFNDGQVVGTVVNDTPDVVTWVRETLADLRTSGRAVTDEMRDLPVASVAASQGTRGNRQRSRLPRALRADGFIRLSPTYFDRREPVDPVTAYRSGLGLVEVAAGYAADRTTGDTAQSVSSRLLDRLADKQAIAVVGPAGVGKSTVCKQVAHRWYEADRGAVFYRSDDAGRHIEHPEELLELARNADGHALIVVEGTGSTETRPVLELATALDGTDEVSLLFDIRHGEWDSLDAAASIEPFHLPEIDETDCARLIETVQSLGTTPELPPASELLAAGRETAHEAAIETGVTLGVVHRLATLLDPLATEPAEQTTPLVDDVEAAIEATTAAGPDVFDVALAVQACIVADQPISVDLLYALHDDPQAVDTAIELLTDRALFPPVTDGTYRTVHASWAAMFIDRALDRRGGEAIHDRLTPRLTALLALADDKSARDRLRELVSGPRPLVDRVDRDPQGWADDCITRLQAAPIEYPKIAPAFGSGTGFDFPAVASDGLNLLGHYYRARAAEAGGKLDRALAEITTVRERLNDGASVPPGHTRTEFGVRTNLLAGQIRRNRGALGVAEEVISEALATAKDSGYEALTGQCHYELGDIARQRGAIDAATTHFEAAATHDNPRIRAEGLRGLGRVEHTRGDYEAAAARLDEALAIDERLGDRKGILQTLNVLGANAIVQGEISTAERRFRRSIEIARRLGSQKAEAEALNNLGEVLYSQDDQAAARDHYERALEIARELGVDRSIAIASCNLGRVQCAEGETAAAAERFQEVLSIGERLENPKLEMHAHRGLGTIARRNDDPASAIDRFDRAHAIADEIGDERAAATINADRATAVAATGDRQQALDQLASAVDQLESLDALVDAIDAVDELIDICLETGDPETAAAACRRGIEIAESCDREDHLDRFGDRLSEIKA